MDYFFFLEARVAAFFKKDLEWYFASIEGVSFFSECFIAFFVALAISFV
jgi:hypothetical protein